MECLARERKIDNLAHQFFDFMYFELHFVNLIRSRFNILLLKPALLLFSC